MNISVSAEVVRGQKQVDWEMCVGLPRALRRGHRVMSVAPRYEPYPKHGDRCHRDLDGHIIRFYHCNENVWIVCLSTIRHL